MMSSKQFQNKMYKNFAEKNEEFNVRRCFDICPYFTFGHVWKREKERYSKRAHLFWQRVSNQVKSTSMQPHHQMLTLVCDRGVCFSFVWLLFYFLFGSLFNPNTEYFSFFLWFMAIIKVMYRLVDARFCLFILFDYKSFLSVLFASL